MANLQQIARKFRVSENFLNSKKRSVNSKNDDSLNDILKKYTIDFTDLAKKGKFSLAFSMAPEFYRRVYKKNPIKNTRTFTGKDDNLNISPTSWKEIIARKL